MTSAQTMLTRFRRLRGWWIVLPALLAACRGGGEQLVAPRALMAPYDTSGGDVLWAVVPLVNESGASAADALAISDQVVAAVAQTRGLRCLPLNRTLEAMGSMGLTRLTDPGQVAELAQALGVDGLIVGSVTAYDPYNPPVLGLALALYVPATRDSRHASSSIDIDSIRYQPTDYRPFPRSTFPDAGPATVVAEHLDGKNEQVQMDLRSYARGRTGPVSALGWRRYLASMDLYTEFATWFTVARLLDGEWLRLARGHR